MLSAWRLTKTKYLAAAWNGEGAKKAGGRWNSAGVAVVYVSGSLSLALVEVLVHLPPEILPAFSAVPVAFDDSLVTEVPPARLPPAWKDSPPPPATQAIGDQWVASGASAVLRVPSVIVPGEPNFILNPAHPDFGRIRIGTAMSFPFDPRLAHGGRAVNGERG
jgi:RES domain-containing protein